MSTDFFMKLIYPSQKPEGEKKFIDPDHPEVYLNAVLKILLKLRVFHFCFIEKGRA